MLIGIAAVQAEIRSDCYLNQEAFNRRVLRLADTAAQSLPKVPRIIAFPELFAMPLLFWLETQPQAHDSKTMLQAALKIIGSNTRHWTPRGFYHLRTPKVYPTYEAAFKKAAIRTKSYILAGTLLGPLIDWEPSRGYHATGSKAYNWGLFFSPQGTILARPIKERLTSTERMSLLSPGRSGNVRTAALGTIANLICLDAFHESLIEIADALGAWLLIQPSANSRAWSGAWSGDIGQGEGEVWLREGLAKKLVGRENLRYGINPMLNGKFYELEFEGRSSLAQAGGFLALAEKPVGDEILTATVELPGHTPPLAKG